MGPVGEEEPASAQIGQRDRQSDRVDQLTARAHASAARPPPWPVRWHAEWPMSSVAIPRTPRARRSVSRLTSWPGRCRRPPRIALRIAQKAVERASKIAQAPSGGSGHAAGRGASEWGRRNDLSRPGRAARADPRVSEDPSRARHPGAAGDRTMPGKAPATTRAAGAWRLAERYGAACWVLPVLMPSHAQARASARIVASIAGSSS